MDFTQMGFDDATVVMTADMLSFASTSSVGQKIRIFDKSKLIRGQSLTWFDFINVKSPDGDIGFQPVQHYGPATRFYLVGPANCVSRNLQRTVFILAIDNPLTSSALSFQRTPALGLCSFTSPPRAPQPGGPPLQFFEQSGVVFRNGTLWNTEMIGAASDTVQGVLWYQIDVSAWPAPPALVQSSVFASPGIWYFGSAFTVDQSNNMAMILARSSPTEFASSTRISAAPRPV